MNSLEALIEVLGRSKVCVTLSLYKRESMKRRIFCAHQKMHPIKSFYITRYYQFIYLYNRLKASDALIAGDVLGTHTLTFALEN